MVEGLEAYFPLLGPLGYTVTSEATWDYNCIAWAVGNDDAVWWPDPFNQYFWPQGIPRSVTLQAFRQMFESRGYRVCDSPDPEPSFEKVAIYASPAGAPTHAALQLRDGTWTSKLGKLEDITHKSLKAVSGKEYGLPTLFLKRPRTPE
jgi:hypothetical protein